jgi:hypothetical protein
VVVEEVQDLYIIAAVLQMLTTVDLVVVVEQQRDIVLHKQQALELLVKEIQEEMVEIKGQAVAAVLAPKVIQDFILDQY